jgi:acyl-CoA synthetase (AMP-forming)/AMP-acid ligase II
MSVLSELDQIRSTLSGPGQPFEFTDAAVMGQRLSVYKNLPPNLSHFIVAASSLGDRTFLVSGELRLSYREALGRAAGLAHCLRSRFGAGANVRVAIAMRNSPEWIIAFLAIQLAEATASLVNSRGTAEDMIFALRDTECAILIADRRRAEAIAPGFSGDVIVAGEDGAFRDAAGAPLEYASAEPVPSAAGPDDPAVIMFTSGTTGRPKGAVLTHRGVGTFLFGMRHNGAVYLTHMARKLGMEPASLAGAMPQPATLAIFPLFHVSGASAMLMGAVINGGKIVFVDRWDPALALRLIAAEKITMLQGPPAIFWDILGCPALKTTDTSTLTNIGIGGQATPPNLLDALLKAFPKASPGGGFGQTETNGAICSATGPEYMANPAGSGRVLPGTEIRIIDENGNDLPTGSAGEVWVKSPLVMAGYWNQPEANKAAFQDGWLRTGDVGFLDENRFIVIVDRKKDVVIRGGENIYCAELERVFADYPGVMEVAAFGVEDERWGERVVLAAVPHHSHRIDTDSMLAFGRTRLADYKIPSEIVVSEAPFVRNSVGKVDKAALRTWYRGL